MKSGGEIYPLVTFSFQKVQEHTALFLHQEKKWCFNTKFSPDISQIEKMFLTFRKSKKKDVQHKIESNSGFGYRYVR